MQHLLGSILGILFFGALKSDGKQSVFLASRMASSGSALQGARARSQRAVDSEEEEDEDEDGEEEDAEDEDDQEVEDDDDEDEHEDVEALKKKSLLETETDVGESEAAWASYGEQAAAQAWQLVQSVSAQALVAKENGRSMSSRGGPKFKAPKTSGGMGGNPIVALLDKALKACKLPKMSDIISAMVYLPKIAKAMLDFPKELDKLKLQVTTGKAFQTIKVGISKLGVIDTACQSPVIMMASMTPIGGFIASACGKASAGVMKMTAMIQKAEDAGAQANDLAAQVAGAADAGAAAGNAPADAS